MYGNLSDFIINFGDVVELEFPKWNVHDMTQILLRHPGWTTYQPHKPGHNRFGLSVTSLDGKFTGEPDLYSLREYANLTGKNYKEIDFQTRTSVVELFPELNSFLDFWGPDLGRVHFLRLDKGGFFPPHRDNGAMISVESFRILVPINNFNTNDMKWIQEEQVLNLRLSHYYFINTSRLHSVFSFVDNCIMLVLNVYPSTNILQKMAKKIVGI